MCAVTGGCGRLKKNPLVLSFRVIFTDLCQFVQYARERVPGWRDKRRLGQVGKGLDKERLWRGI